MTQRAATISKTTGIAIGLVIPLVAGAFWLSADRSDLRGQVTAIERRNVDQDETIRQITVAIEGLQKESKDGAAWRGRVETDIGYIRRVIERTERADRTRKAENES